jgi:hypothetical protein
MGTPIDLDQAIGLLKKIVKENGTNDMVHLDVTLIPAEDRPVYQRAMKIAKMAIVEGKISQQELLGKIHLI